MKKRIPLLAILLLMAAVLVHSENHIIYVAHQDWLSRVYIMRMDGSVVNYYEYSMYYFCDVEIANGEIHIAEAFAPRSYLFDPYTGSIDVIIDDWSLYYFYDLAFDGTYFYVTEWDLNRYDINGNKDGTASFDEDVMGGAWNGSFSWTLNDTNEIRCWDLSGWPTVTEVAANGFAPPTSACRGLWFDGQYFWTAESYDGYLGSIYQFDTTGAIIAQWSEPAYRGWAACVVDLAGIEESDEKVQRSEVMITAHPNPFRDKVEIQLQSESEKRGIGETEIQVYDVGGRRVREISLLPSCPVRESFSNGVSFSLGAKATWDGRDDAGKRLPPGVYLLKMQLNGFSVTEKVILVK
jgi:hypothetical protein